MVEVQLLEKLHLVNGDYLTHAAALLFYAEPERLVGGIQISVYPDKLMIWNPGELPPNWTVDELLLPA